MIFYEIALEMVARGIPVVPIPAKQKGPKLFNWPERASMDLDQLKRWNDADPNQNCGCVATDQGVWILDLDDPTLLTRIEHETGQSLPKSLWVQSGKGIHIYFKQNDASRKMGNRAAPALFDVLQHHKQAVAPGSTHPTGRIYKRIDDSPMPVALDCHIAWLIANSSPEKASTKKVKDEVEMSPEWDEDEFIAWGEEAGAFEVEREDEWRGKRVIVLRECIMAGHKHSGSESTGFILGGGLGYHCFSSDCAEYTIGDVLRQLREDGYVYPGKIWDDAELDFAALNVDLGEAILEKDDAALAVPTEVVVDTPKPPKFDDGFDLVEAPVVAEPRPLHQQPVVKPGPLAMPDTCLYGWLGEKARELQCPMGFAYPAMTAVFAAQNIPTFGAPTIRPTVYVCLIGPVAQGKGRTTQRALDSLIIPIPGTIKRITPASDRGLANIFSEKKLPPHPGQNQREPVEPIKLLRTHLLELDELKHMLGKMNISNSGLAPTLCTLWSQDEGGSADKDGAHSVLIRLNILCGLKAKNAEDFATGLGTTANDGLYDRFIYGVGSRGWEFDEAWRPNREGRVPKNVSAPHYVFDLLKEWVALGRTQGKIRGRIKEIVLRWALITASANHDSVITPECIKAAIAFGEWQERIREVYTASEAEGLDARCTDVLLKTFEKQPGKWFKFSDLMKSKSWYKTLGARPMNAAKDALVKGGLLEEEEVPVEHGDGSAGSRKTRKTGKLRYLALESTSKEDET
jgi:hypothetical protein